jgi:hypothetical protein
MMALFYVLELSEKVEVAIYIISLAVYMYILIPQDACLIHSITFLQDSPLVRENASMPGSEMQRCELNLEDGKPARC